MANLIPSIFPYAPDSPEMKKLKDLENLRETHLYRRFQLSKLQLTFPKLFARISNVIFCRKWNRGKTTCGLSNMAVIYPIKFSVSDNEKIQIINEKVCRKIVNHTHIYIL